MLRLNADIQASGRATGNVDEQCSGAARRNVVGAQQVVLAHRILIVEGDRVRCIVQHDTQVDPGRRKGIANRSRGDRAAAAIGEDEVRIRRSRASDEWKIGFFHVTTPIAVHASERDAIEHIATNGGLQGDHIDAGLGIGLYGWLRGIARAAIAEVPRVAHRRRARIDQRLESGVHRAATGGGGIRETVITARTR